MEAFLQSNHSGSRNRCVRTIIIDHRFVIDVQDTAIIRTGLESIDSILGYIDQPGKMYPKWSSCPASFMNGSGRIPDFNNGDFSISATF